MSEQNLGFESRAIHAGSEPDPTTGSVVTPIYATSTYKQDGVGGLRGGYEYSRSANPTRTALEECIAALEGGRHGLAFASGLAAEDTLLRALCSPGDHVVVPDDAYGGSFRLFAKVAGPWGLEHTSAHVADTDAMAAAIRPGQTKVVWVETPTNPLLTVADIAAIADLAHQAGALLVVDNTFASPYLQQPLSLGADVVVHSTTKYCGGHSDVVGGALVTSDDARRGAAPLPPERHRRRRRSVRRVARAPRPEDPRGAHGAALRQRGGRRRAPRRAPRGVPGDLPRARRAPRSRARDEADAAVRRHRVVPGEGRRAGRPRRVRRDEAVDARRSRSAGSSRSSSTRAG